LLCRTDAMTVQDNDMDLAEQIEVGTIANIGEISI
jgi:hypothetical protein